MASFIAADGLPFVLLGSFYEHKNIQACIVNSS